MEKGNADSRTVIEACRAMEVNPRFPQDPNERFRVLFRKAFPEDPPELADMLLQAVRKVSEKFRS